MLEIGAENQRENVERSRSKRLSVLGNAPQRKRNSTLLLLERT